MPLAARMRIAPGEIPLYVDTAIERCEGMTGELARHASGKTFAEIRAERRIMP
jgi:hypothetical protein